MNPLLYNQQLGRRVNPPFGASIQDSLRINSLETKLKLTGLWPKLINVFPFCGTTRATQSANIRNPGNPLVITSDSSAVYASKGFIPGAGFLGTCRTDFVASSASLGVGVSGGPPKITRDVAGDGGINLFLRYSDNFCYSDLLDGSEYVGHLSPSHSSAIASRGPVNGQRLLLDDFLVPTVGPLTANTGVGNVNWSFAPGSTSTYSFFFTGTYLTTDEMSTAYSVFNEYARSVSSY